MFPVHGRVEILREDEWWSGRCHGGVKEKGSLEEDKVIRIF
jgi:hypothetical protein